MTRNEKHSLYEWLISTAPELYYSPSKLQYFLFFYECFSKATKKSLYSQGTNHINLAQAEKCAFLIKALSEQDLSDLTHRMNIWKRIEDRIMGWKSQVVLSEADFNESDKVLIQMLDCMYPIDFVQQAVVIPINNYNFVLKKEDLNKLPEGYHDMLSLMTETVDLYNPVYIEIDDHGKLIVD